MSINMINTLVTFITIKIYISNFELIDYSIYVIRKVAALDDEKVSRFINLIFIFMLKNPNSRVYAIVDASDNASVAVLKSVLTPFEPKYREGKTLTISGVQDVLFVEFRKREGPMFDIMKTMALQWNLYPFYVVEENKGHRPKSDKYGNACEYHIVDAAIFDFPMPAEKVLLWQDEVRAKAKEIYRNDSVFLKFHVYWRPEDQSIHALCGNTENTNRHNHGEVVLGEEGWREAVCKLAEALNVSIEFRQIRYKNL